MKIGTPINHKWLPLFLVLPFMSLAFLGGCGSDGDPPVINSTETGNETDNETDNETGSETGSETGNETGSGPTEGDLNIVNIGDSGTAKLKWLNDTLTGDVTIADGVPVSSVGLYSGIAAAGNGQLGLTLNGSAPTYSIPTGLSAVQQAFIADNISSGNLYLQIERADVGVAYGTVLIEGVVPGFIQLSSASNVPPSDPAPETSGRAYFNLNKLTGDFAAAVEIDIAPVDNETITNVHIHTGSATENGPPIVTLVNDAGDGVLWTRVGILSTADLASVTSGSAYFNVHKTDGSDFIRGQITQ